MQDNYQRGKHVIFWTKLYYIFGIAFNLLFALLIHLCGDFSNFDETMFTQGFMTKAILAAFAFMLFSFVVFAFFVVYYIFWILWLHREGTNLRVVSKTDFPPALAVFCTSIPVIGGIFDYFILRDIIRAQGNALRAYGKPAAPMPNLDLTIFFVATIASIALYFVKSESVSFLVTAVLCAVILRSMVRVLRQCIEQGRILVQTHDDVVLRAKVDEVLRERELAKAACEAGQAAGEVPADIQ